jgi:acyl carrier protein
VTEQDVAVAVEEFIRREFSIGAADENFAHDVDLFEDGYVDSVGVIELLAFLEGAFGVEIPEEDLFSPEFSTIHGIASIVTRHRPANRDAPSRNVPTDE